MNTSKLIGIALSIILLSTLLPASAFAEGNHDLPQVTQSILENEHGQVTQEFSASSNSPGDDPKKTVSIKKYGPIVWNTEAVSLKRKIQFFSLFSTATATDTCFTSTFNPDFVDQEPVKIPFKEGDLIYNDPLANLLQIFGLYKDESDGKVYRKQQLNRISGDVISTQYDCVKPSEPANTPPKGKPVPPTYQQIWQKVYDQTFIDQSVNNGAYVLPVTSGVTGLPSKFWVQYQGGQNITRVTNINGFNIVAEAKIAQVQIIVKTPKGNSTTIATLNQNPLTGKIDDSSYTNPAATYKYRSTGNYVITTGIVWTANITISGQGIIAPIVVPGGSLRVELNRDYRVNQLRAGLTQ